MEKGLLDRTFRPPGVAGVLLSSFVPVWVLLSAGCGGSAGSGADPEAETIQRPSSPITTTPENTFNVTISSSGGQFPVDKLEIEFNRRRGIHEFYGFYRDSYDELQRVPFSELQRVDFLGEMPPPIFDQAIVGKEHLNLRQDNAFEVRLTFKDRRQEDFFAIIPKFRGEKDLQLWEFSMSSRKNPFDYIEFHW